MIEIKLDKPLVKKLIKATKQGKLAWRGCSTGPYTAETSNVVLSVERGFFYGDYRFFLLVRDTVTDQSLIMHSDGEFFNVVHKLFRCAERNSKHQQITKEENVQEKNRAAAKGLIERLDKII